MYEKEVNNNKWGKTVLKCIFLSDVSIRIGWQLRIRCQALKEISILVCLWHLFRSTAASTLKLRGGGSGGLFKSQMTQFCFHWFLYLRVDLECWILFTNFTIMYFMRFPPKNISPSTWMFLNSSSAILEIISKGKWC